MKHHTKNKGDLGVLKAKADLCGKGFLILSPESEHSPFDFVIYDGVVFKTIQVKARTITNGVLNVSFRSSWADKHGTHNKNIDKSQIDIYCIYCLNNDICYYLDPKEFKDNFSLRVEVKNKEQKNMNIASNFLKLPVSL